MALARWSIPSTQISREFDHDAAEFKICSKSIRHRSRILVLLSARGMTVNQLTEIFENLRDPEQFALAKQELAEISKMPDVKLAYFDEATFSLSGVVPSGWQDIGKRESIDTHASWFLSESIYGKTSNTQNCPVQHGAV